MPMRTMHRVNGNMFQDLLRYEEEAREMTEQKDVLVQADMTVGSLAAKHARTWGCSDPSAVSMLEAFGKQLLRVEHAQDESDKFKLVYIKRWRTLFKVPASIADEVRDALNAEQSDLTQARDLVESARAQAIEECAAMMQQWRDDFAAVKGNQTYVNVCQNAAVAIRNMASNPSTVGEPK